MKSSVQQQPDLAQAIYAVMAAVAVSRLDAGTNQADLFQRSDLYTLTYDGAEVIWFPSCAGKYL